MAKTVTLILFLSITFIYSQSSDYNCIIVDGCTCVPDFTTGTTFDICSNELAACYSLSSCQKTLTGGCAWAPNDAFATCLQKQYSNPCVRAGCNNEFCVSYTEAPIYNPCDVKSYYQCFNTALCQLQDSGRCGWSISPSLSNCLTANGFYSTPVLAENTNTVSTTTGLLGTTVTVSDPASRVNLDNYIDPMFS